jgi:hypothetical protein
MLFADGLTIEEKRPLLDFRPLAGNIAASAHLGHLFEQG